MSVRQINSKIVSYSVMSDEQKQAQNKISEVIINEASQKTEMNENIERPNSLVGRTYKIEKSPFSEHALYVTMNDIILDEGSEHEIRRPFEMFINSKNMAQFQWIVAMTRIISAVFRKGGDVTFLVEEMKAIFDPQGGYFRSGGYVPSLVAEIGQVIERHLQSIGMMDKAHMDDATQALISEKKALLKARSDNLEQSLHPKKETLVDNTKQSSTEQSSDDKGVFPPNATSCKKCYQKAVIVMDGCATCLNCGDSKCG